MAGESLTSNARRALPIRNRFTKPSKEKPFSVGIASSPSGNPQRAGRLKRVRCGQHPCDWAVRDLQAEDRGVAQTLTLIGLAPRIGGDGQTLTSESESAGNTNQTRIPDGMGRAIERPTQRAPSSSPTE